MAGAPPSPVLRVRTAVADDIPGIVRCGADLLTEDAAARDPRVDPGWVLREGRAAFAATLEDPACLLLVAVRAGGAQGTGRLPAEGGQAQADAVAGYAIGALSEPVGVLPIRSAVLRALYVAPEHRGAGTGARLTAEFFSWARAKGAVRAEVNAYTANEDGLRFYRRQGFAPRAVRLDLDLSDADSAAPAPPSYP
ncbi:GNAT family N-acetyltransferase [Actinacidiphila acididurans]|uniref:GNAT family N-acetyltransferase n=1 Tax=Actinacidiphila acididurans TaxID=2784346 RepID=A0ABS2U137_9ACTN|nr:GNAT family N-acetyltransferase [Actinacidiphila acididurans]MBM9507908.1 GNAT family N-acetyltransferase [Actinacidiphila acididurans]